MNMHTVIVNGERYVPEQPYNRILNDHEWRALESAENALYRPGTGGNGYTDVMDRESSHMVASVWDYCQDQIEAAEDNRPTIAQVAARVARVIMTMAFGPESLLR
jgi:hypothetical protein